MGTNSAQQKGRDTLFGNKIKTARQEKGQSQYEMAEEIGITKSALAMYERDERIPRDEVKIKIAQYAGTTVGALFFNEN